MAVTIAEFLERLAASGIVADADLAAVRAEAGPETGGDAEGFVKRLHKTGRLTGYQAQALWKGKGSTLAFGNYVVEDELGRGGMGVVLKARHKRMKRHVAIKVLPAAMTRDKDAIARFQREVEAASQLEHPNIVAAYDADEIDGQHILVMQFVDGRDLASVVKKNRPLSVEQAVDCVMQAARGLEFAHQQGVIHRDIKPANLLLDAKGTVKILDMGLARFSDGAGVGEQAELTGTGTVMGTVDYMSPEQALNTKDADARSDIYSLGITLHFLLTGKPAYSGDSLMARLMAHANQPIPDLRRDRSDVPEELQAVFARMVAKSPDERQQTMTEVLADLERCTGAASGTAVVATAPVMGEESSGGLSRFLTSLDDGNASPSAQTVPAPLRRSQSGEELATVAEPDAAQTFVDAADNGTLRSLQAQGKTKGKGTSRRQGTRTSTSPSPPWTDPRVLTAAGAAAVLLLAAVVFFLRTPHGTLRVEIADPEIEVSVKGTQIVLKGADTQDVTLKPGEHVLHVQRGDFAFETTTLILKKGETVVVKVELLDGEIQVAGDGRPLGRHPLPGGASPDGATVAGSPGKPTAPAFLGVPLFDGRSLKGWTVHPEDAAFWTVADGVLRGASGQRTSHLILERNDLTDFHLRVEARVAAGVNAGIVCREPTGAATEANRDRALGYLAKINANAADPRKTGSLYVMEPNTHNDGHTVARSPVPAGQWFTLDVVIVDHRVRIMIDGVTTTDFEDTKRRFARGGLALQSFRNFQTNGAVEFRKIELMELTASGGPTTTAVPAPPTAVAPFDAQQARAHQEAWARHLGTTVATVNGIGMQFVLIPPGEFLRGVSEEEIERRVNAGDSREELSRLTPQHRVRLTRPMLLGAHEVTQEQYQQVMGHQRASYAAGRTLADKVAGQDTSRFPVESVDWRTAIDFCIQLSRREGLEPYYKRAGNTVTIVGGDGYRLPTEAEWEFACRAGTETRWWFGDDERLLRQSAQFTASATKAPRPVGLLAPNPFGLYDVIGNVKELCWDTWDPVYYANFAAETAVDPQGPTTGLSEQRVIRDLTFDASSKGSAYGRASLQFNLGFSSTGFRVGRTIEHKPPPVAQNVATSFRGKQYRAFAEILSWHEARDRCAALGGRLAIVRSAEEQAFLVDLLKSAGMDAAWIGATDEEKEGEWVWVDGTALTYTNWNSGEPNNKPPGEHYLAVVLNFRGSGYDGRWSDQPAVAKDHPKIGYVCQWDAPPAAPSVSDAPLSGPELFELLTDDQHWQWSEPESLGPHIDTKYNENSPAVSGDGLLLVFHADIPGGASGRGFGKWDLWMCERASLDEPFSAPENLGPDVNSPENDMHPWLSLDGLTLVFSTAREGAAVAGGGDLWISTRASRDEPFGAAIRIPAVNTASVSPGGALSADGRVIVFSSFRGGNNDLWQATRIDPLAPFGRSVRLGDEINDSSSQLYPWLSADGRVLVYTVIAKSTTSAEGEEQTATSESSAWAALRPDVDSPFAPPQRLSVPLPAGVKSGVRHPSLTADGRWLYVQVVRHAEGSVQHKLYVTRRVPRVAAEVGAAPPTASPDGGPLASMAHNGTLRLWNVANGTPQAAWQLGPIGGRVRTTAVAPIGRSLTAAKGNETIDILLLPEEFRAGKAAARNAPPPVQSSLRFSGLFTQRGGNFSPR